MIEAALTTRLGALAANVWQSAAPPGASAPMVIFNRFSTDPVDDLDGQPVQAFAMVQIDVYDADGVAAAALANAIRHSLTSWSDAIVKSASFHDERHFVDDTTKVRLYRVCQNYMLFANLD